MRACSIAALAREDAENPKGKHLMGPCCPRPDVAAQMLSSDATKAAQRAKIDAFYYHLNLLTSVRKLNCAGGMAVQRRASFNPHK
jgi:hypothetical protein